MTRASSTMMPVRSRGPEDPSLDAFLAAVRDSNPFLANRVTEPSAYDVDVQGIHADAFNRLVKLAAQAHHRDRSAIGAMLLGNAGIGKSHLLSRLYRWANQGDGGGPGHACYVYLLNILADPDRLARYLLKCVVSRLAEGGRGPLYETPLYRLVDGAIRHALGASSYTLKDGREAFRSRYADVVPMKDVGEVLFQFVRHARPDKASDPSRLYLASQAAAWLSGEEIDPGPAGSLGLRVDGQESIQLGDDQQVMHVLLSLTRLAHANGQPFVLCVDQVDILDADKLKALTRFLQALIDQAKNLLVITSGIKSTLLQFKQDDIIPDSSWDRIAQYTVELGRVRVDDARRILEARLERFHEPFMPLDRIRGQVLKDTLFPLGRAWLDRQLSDVVEFRPRDVLIWARDAWDDEQSKLTSQGGDRWLAEWPTTKPPGPKPIPHKPTQAEIESEIDATVGRKTEEHVAQRQLQPGSLPPDAGNLAGLVEALLGQCLGDGLPYTLRGVERKKKQKGVLPPYDLLVREHREDDSREVTTGVLFVTNIGLSATTALRRLLEDGSPPDHRILVTDHERRPLKVGPQGVAYYRDLERLGPRKFEHIKIDFEQYAVLDALEGVINMGRVGDLEVEIPRGTIRPVSDQDVIASHHRRDRYRNHQALHPLLTEAPPVVVVETPEVVALDEKDVRQYVMGQLAWRMGATAGEIAKGYLGMMPAPGVEAGAAWLQFKKIAGRMHAEGLVHAQPMDNDLLLVLRK